MKKTLIKNILLQVVLVVITIFALELITRGLKLAPTVSRLRTGITKSAYQMSDNQKLGYVLKANYRDDDHPDLNESFPYTNALGQRDIERTIERIPAKKRILMLGDSVVDGHGIYDLNDTMSRQLEKLYDNKVEVLNFGIGGYCSSGEVELLRVNGLQYKPDVVVLVFVVNDYAQFNTQVSNYEFKRPQWTEKLFLRSDLFRYLSLRLDLFHFKDQVDPNYVENWHWNKMKSNGQFPVQKAFHELKEMSEKYHFKLVTVIWPSFSDRDVNDLRHPVSEEGKLAVESYAEEAKIPYFRLSPYFEKHHSTHCAPTDMKCRNWKDTYTIGDGCHPNPTGTKIGAEAIQSILSKLNY